MLLVGYFEGLDSERGIAWRAADSLAVREFVGLGLDTAAPDHSTLSRTRRLIALETHRAVFTWVQERLAAAGLLKGRTVAIDATTLEANAAMRSIVRRDTGETYQEFLTRLATESGIRTPTREALARLDRRRKKRTSNKDWRTPSDPDAKITKMKDGRTHLAHKAEHAIDLDSGALVAVTLHGADVGDTTSLGDTVVAAIEQAAAAQAGSRAGGAHRARRRQGLSQQSDPDRFGRHRGPVLHRGAESGPAPVDDGPGRATGRVRQSAARARRARSAVAASTRRVCGAIVRARLRHGRDAPHALARASQHSQTPADSRERLQSRSAHAAIVRARHAARPPRTPTGRALASHGPLDALRAVWLTVGAPLAPCRRPPPVLHSHPAWAIA